MAQVRLADLVGKTIEDYFVPADRKAVTVLLQEGRMSLGAPVVYASSVKPLGGARVLSTSLAPISDSASQLTIMTDKGSLNVTFEGAPALVELPE